VPKHWLFWWLHVTSPPGIAITLVRWTAYRPGPLSGPAPCANKFTYAQMNLARSGRSEQFLIERIPQMALPAIQVFRESFIPCGHGVVISFPSIESGNGARRSKTGPPPLV
jgi:hypothetical protein